MRRHFENLVAHVTLAFDFPAQNEAVNYVHEGNKIISSKCEVFFISVMDLWD